MLSRPRTSERTPRPAAARGAALLAAAAFVLPALPGFAAPADAPGASARWGIGWNGGFAVHRIGGGWGCGASLSNNFTVNGGDHDTNPGVPFGAGGTSVDERHRYSNSLELAVVGYRELPVTSWLAAGPYASLAWTHWHYQDRSQRDLVSGDMPLQYRSLAEDINETRRERFTLEVGLRPVLRLHPRLLLETRLGLYLAHAHQKYKIDHYRREETAVRVREDRSRSRRHEDRTVFGFRGEELALLRFLILL